MILDQDLISALHAGVALSDEAAATSALVRAGGKHAVHAVGVLIVLPACGIFPWASFTFTDAAVMNVNSNGVGEIGFSHVGLGVREFNLAQEIYPFGCGSRRDVEVVVIELSQQNTRSIVSSIGGENGGQGVEASCDRVSSDRLSPV